VMPTPAPHRLAGIVLCGGQSTRMGTPKPLLEFAGRPLLSHVVSAVSQAAHPVVVSAAADQDLPPLDADIQIVRDTVADAGPLQGIADAASTLADRADLIFVTGCDAPFITPAIIGRLADLLGTHQAAVPLLHGRRQPLLAVYRADALATLASRRLAQNRPSLMGLLDALDLVIVPDHQLADLDPNLDIARNLNSPDDLRQALNRWHQKAEESP
ncbi:MAG: molybdenum cofactor guanylyltransferase, partial [Phycisphaerae bacterium]